MQPAIAGFQLFLDEQIKDNDALESKIQPIKKSAEKIDKKIAEINQQEEIQGAGRRKWEGN